MLQKCGSLARLWLWVRAQRMVLDVPDFLYYVLVKDIVLPLLPRRTPSSFVLCTNQHQPPLHHHQHRFDLADLAYQVNTGTQSYLIRRKATYPKTHLHLRGLRCSLPVTITKQKLASSERPHVIHQSEGRKFFLQNSSRGPWKHLRTTRSTFSGRNIDMVCAKTFYVKQPVHSLLPHEADHGCRALQHGTRDVEL
ncbi:hypothetical protein M427DRAFT_60225 [Gonapodya prolifera JEL478]|uniref:Uncharacterized protein n=1 Tax=Gonapodya prolifera (strain JEL478) TaxID=1344416 RepID=A0A139A4P3_GONPJ|nr:hypothetical protein M427DRAFT_60225 [Gonapodya prolifera JEL478]|eukprot:KXS11777.1 hypothetical protein M427DRAFT_60225 [Gonapodya prolifera JEL478]